VPVEPVHHFEGELDETMEESPLESDLVEEEVVWPEKPYEEVPDVSGPEESLPVQSESTAETENTPFPPGTEVSSLTESIDGSPEIDTSIEEGEDALEQAYQSLEGPGELMDEEIEVFFPEKPEERLELARVAVQEGRLKQALEIYSSLINSSELLDSVINDLEESTARYPDDFTGFQVLGDAYVKSGRLPSALRAYRTALSKT
jgi:tetratricopeptide (TPR) repeat protein